MSEAEDWICALTVKPTPRPKGTNKEWNRIVCAWLDLVRSAVNHANLRMQAEHWQYEWTSLNELQVKALSQELYGAMVMGCKEAFDGYFDVEDE